MKLHMLSLAWAFATITPICYASSPASKQYIDAQVTSLRAQIASIPGVAHPVGSCYGGGVVYYVNTSSPGAQQHGLIASPTDANAGNNAAWVSRGILTTIIASGSTYFTGEANTNLILDAINPNISLSFPAAIAAVEYNVPGDSCPACTGWYLPSQEELVTLYAQATSSIALGNANFWANCKGTSPQSQNYWSSTQRVSNTAWYVFFQDGSTTSQSITRSYYVRSVRAF